MIVRIWRTGVDPARVDEFRAFAAERSLPMFERQEGFLGVLFTETEHDYATVSFWRDAASVDALGRSESYAETVAALVATGLLTGEQTVEVFHVGGGRLTPGVVEPGAAGDG